MIVYSNGSPREVLRAKPSLDREASAALARKLFRERTVIPLDDGDLSCTNPSTDEIIVGCFPGVSIVAAAEFGFDIPSCLPIRFRGPELGSTVHVHVMNSVVDQFAFAVWENGELRRAFSATTENGLIESLGEPLPFEIPYWQGQHLALNDDPTIVEEEETWIPFHPLDLGEEAWGALFGYHLEGFPDLFDPEEVPLLRFRKGGVAIRQLPVARNRLRKPDDASTWQRLLRWFRST